MSDEGFLQSRIIEKQARIEALEAALQSTGDLHRRLDDRIEQLEAALRDLVNAKALSGVRAIVSGWNGEGRDKPFKERHPYRLGATLPTCCGEVYELDEAMQAARAALAPEHDK